MGCPDWISAQCGGSFLGLWCPAHLHPGDGAGQAVWVGSPELPGESCWLCQALPSQFESPVSSQAAEGGRGELQKGKKNHPWLVSACAWAASSPKMGFWELRSDDPHGYTPILYSKGPGSAIRLPHCKHGLAAPGEQPLPSRRCDCSQLRVAGHNIFLFSFTCSPAYFTICCIAF